MHHVEVEVDDYNVHQEVSKQYCTYYKCGTILKFKHKVKVPSITTTILAVYFRDQPINCI